MQPVIITNDNDDNRSTWIVSQEIYCFNWYALLCCSESTDTTSNPLIWCPCIINCVLCYMYSCTENVFRCDLNLRLAQTYSYNLFRFWLINTPYLSAPFNNFYAQIQQDKTDEKSRLILTFLPAMDTGGWTQSCNHIIFIYTKWDTCPNNRNLITIYTQNKKTRSLVLP